MPQPSRLLSATLAVLLGVASIAALEAQDRRAMKPASDAPSMATPSAEAPRLTGRLPNYYSSAAAVSDEQRLAIYRIQADYDAQIDELLQEIEDLRAERREKSRAVLTDEQRKAVDLAKAEARERRAARRESK